MTIERGMVESLVLELQRLASSPGERLSDLLRKALIVATKLGLDDFRTWIEGELEGYRVDTVPDYRKIYSHICVRNPYQGLSPVIMPDSKTQMYFCNIPISQSVESLCEVIGKEKDTGYVEYIIPPEREMVLRRRVDTHGMSLVGVISKNELSAILDTVRTRILKWALKLEAEGILGEGMSFSVEEKKKAQTSTVVNIEHFSGILGTINGGQVLQNVQANIQNNDFASLETVLADIGIAKDDIAILQDAVNQDPPQQQPDKFGPRVGKWLGTMVQKAAEGGLKIGVDVTSKVLSEALLKYYGLRP